MFHIIVLAIINVKLILLNHIDVGYYLVAFATFSFLHVFTCHPYATTEFCG